MRKGTTVQTPHGPGLITTIEVHRNFKRYGVVHINPSDRYRNGEEVFYFRNEIKKLKTGETE